MFLLDFKLIEILISFYYLSIIYKSFIRCRYFILFDLLCIILYIRTKNCDWLIQVSGIWFVDKNSGTNFILLSVHSHYINNIWCLINFILSFFKNAISFTSFTKKLGCLWFWASETFRLILIKIHMNANVIETQILY